MNHPIKINPLTKNQIWNYLKNPHFCPVCDSPHIIAGEWDAEIQSQTVYCDACKAEWREIFTMHSIELRN